MASSAIMFYIVPGMRSDVIDFAEEIKGPRFKEYEESRRDLGITVEKAWIETTPEGDAFILYFESADLKRAMEKMGESEHVFDLWFRDKMYALAGADLCDFRVVAPSELIFESPIIEMERPQKSVAAIFPVLEGKREGWRDLIEELEGPRKEEYRDYMSRFGLSLERLFLEETDKGDRIILYAEGEDPAGAIARFARSNHPFDVWLREEMLLLSGIDFIRRQTAPPPHELLYWKSESGLLAA